ncbi:MAG: response regulator [Bacilli bacterium]|nr:response regulator [Bacilli bacterium]
MVNFIVCEDNQIILQRNVDIINKTMFGNNINYKIYAFSSYTEHFKNLIKSNIENKIYILDIELDEISGITIARDIRDIDLESLIVISTSHTDYLPYALKSKLMLFDFVSKFEDYDENLSDVILKILNSVKARKYIKFKCKGKEEKIYFEDITFIKYLPEKNITLIKTKHGQFETYKSFKILTKDLDNSFKKINENYYINKSNAVPNKRNTFSHKNKKERSVIK